MEVDRTGSRLHAASASERGRRASRVTPWLIALAVAIPAIPVVVGIVLYATSSAAAPRGTVLHPLQPRPVAAVSAPAPLTSQAPFWIGGPSRLSRQAPHWLVGSAGFQVARVITATAIRAAPNGAVIAPQPTTTPFGSPVTYLVRQVRDGWLGVVSPLVGNGQLGWIPTSAATLSSLDWELQLSLGRRELSVLHDGAVVERYEVAIGTASAPTPTGTFAVTDLLSTGDPQGPYGCCILALSAVAPHAIQDWSGGNRIAIHSTPPDTYWSIGQAISHGCVHVTLPEGQWLIDHIPLGTPTIIRSD